MNEDSIDLIRHRQEVASRYADALAGFAGVCQQFCDVIDARDEVDTYDFLERLDHFLPLVYAASRLLPLPWEWFPAADDDDAGLDDDDDNVVAIKDVVRGRSTRLRPQADPEAALRSELEARLAEVTYYRAVFDPYIELVARDPAVMPPSIACSLADDIASIDGVLRRNLERYRLNTLGATFEAAQDWRWELDGHLGNHITNAIRAVWSLVNVHTDDWEGEAEPGSAP